MPSDFKLDLPSEGRVFQRSRRDWPLFLIGVLFIADVWAEEPRWSRPPPEFRQVAPLLGTRQAAAAAHLALEKLAPLENREGLRPGDGVTALLTQTEGGQSKQWILALEVIEPTEKERKAPERSARFFSSTGHEFRFGSGRTILEIKIIGPLSDTDSARKGAAASEAKRRRISVSSDFLALGLERVPAMMLRLRAARAANPAMPKGNLQVGLVPPPPETAAANRKWAEAAGVTEADERAVAGSLLALVEFFQITLKTPGLQDVLKSVLDLSWWSLVKSGGKMPAINIEGLGMVKELDAAQWALSGLAEVYAHPFLLHLNGEPALLCQLAVVTPRPPLLVSAGIVGLAAGRPDGKGPILTLQVISSRVAASKSTP